MCLLIDVVLASDYNVQKKVTEEMSKLVNLQMECQRMWDKMVEIVPAIIFVKGAA